jgi:tetratricopeptide (TPR) repeat protein
MAEEEIIILEDGEEASSKEIKKESVKDKIKNKKLIIIIAGVILLLLIILISVYFLTKEEEVQELPDINASQIAKKLQKKEKAYLFSASKLEKMIQKANILYEKGNKKEALKIYENIASFNKAISEYNIGVAQMKEKNFQAALDSFKNAIKNKEHRCVSAINAAICALMLKKEALFNYYIDLAFVYLPEEANSPLYSYYQALINYYKRFYIETLSSLKHPTSSYYQKEQNYIAAKIFALFESDILAIEYLEKNRSINDDLTLGLLYSRIGEYDIAINHLQKSLGNAIEPLRSRIALALAYNKKGMLGSCSNAINAALKDYKEKATDIYPIKAVLKDSLFDVNVAQNEFKQKLFLDEETVFGLIFYFAPYKVFNAKQTINYIRKGGISIFIDEMTPALKYLKRSSTISKVNLAISKGIKSALEYKIHKANSIFKSLLKQYPKHSILHYNLALTYAQIGNYSLAYKHFKTSYYLDSKNYLSGIFAAMNAQMIHKDNSKLIEILKEDLETENPSLENEFYHTLIYLIENNVASVTRWFEKEKPLRPLYLIVDTIAAKRLKNPSLYQNAAAKLKASYKNDIVADIIYLNAFYRDKDIKEFAKQIQKNFKENNFNYDSLYYGPMIAKTIYTKILQIAGLLHHTRDILKKRLEIENEDVIGIMHSLAYIDIFTKNFEEAYVIYNQLIDEYKQDDTNTLFLASVASIGANHPENAIALFELSKLTDPSNFESRYALGLLYQEVKNLKAAAIQYGKIGDIGFQSNFFTFKIVSK